jgi:hypothetical protein
MNLDCVRGSVFLLSNFFGRGRIPNEDKALQSIATNIGLLVWP